jgi:hypothetical protein
MKKILGLLMLFVSLHVFAGTTGMDVQKEEPVDVSLDKGKVTNDDTYLRTLIPFTCVYADGMVQLTLLDGVGEFTLTVTNQMTGERWSAENSLIFLYRLQTSGSYRYTFDSLSLNGNTLYLDCTLNVPEGDLTDDMGNWNIFISVKKSDIANAERLYIF